MASRNIQVNLQFNANVQNARAQLQSLQTQLNNLINSNTTSTSLGITPQIQEATRSAMDLKIALNNAMNVNTGKLNLNKFQSELNRMGKDIGYFAQQMGRLGPEGVKAFTQVASAVAQADTKLFSLQGGMKKLANTFMNTMRWQVTSQAIMAVTSAVSETVSYAKELDTSLNNIRIVTGKSADQMATFAKQANNAAKVLSTSTTKYTDASLIYYQQGLNDKAVKERTDVTVKLANVVGESAQTVSEWMTAIWNNFDNGSESLEYYADVLAKLGAATASSADEIAGGLEKFAAVAETIGLSYEYAASALATITAETRQSEDVVGTALKTILSRMEQLKQGDTLEDGTTLGQYSLALQKVGVDIKDASGELKDMDIILEQTGTRWETLGRDQQIALAQQVAGIRQYTQFMALMDNWDVMEKNLELTEQANGALTEQQRIYEESTKAAEERMKVAGEAIKATLLGGDDMTKLYDIGAGALEIINELLEAFGGLPTILLAVASALTKIYQPQVASFLSQTTLAVKDLFRHPIKALKGENLSTGQQTRLQTLEEAKSLAMKNSPIGTSNLIEAEFKVRERMVIAEKKMSESTRQQLEWELQTLDTQKEQVMLLGQQVEKENLLASKAKAKVENKYSTGNNQMDLSKIEVQANAQGAVQSHLNSALKIASQGQRLDDSTLDSTGRAQIGSALEEQIQKITKQANNLGENLNNIKGFDFLSSKVKDFAKDSTISLQEIIDLITRVQDALSQGVTSKPVIQDEVNNQIGIKKQNVQDSQSVVNSIDNLQGVKTATSERTADTALADIKKNLGGIKEDKLTSKDAKAKIKQWKQQADAIDKTGLSVKEYKEKVNNLINDIKKHTNVQDKNNKTLRGSYNANKRVVEQNKDLSKIEKQLTEDLTKASDAMVQTAETNTDYEESLKGVIDGYEGLNTKLEYTGPNFQSFSNFFANGLSNVTSYAMGLSMLSSSVEQIGNSIAKGEGGLTNWISNISSLMLGIGMLIPAMISMTTGIQGMTRAKLLENIATGVGVTLTGADTEAKEKNLRATLKAKAAAGDLAAAKALEALGHAGSIVAQSWGAAIGIALMAVGLIAPIIGGISGFSSGAKEVKQEEVSKGTESLEAINENQELAGSVEDLTEEYQALRASGESTAEVLEDMREKIPELIDSYKELAKTMGTNIDTSELEKAYEVFEKTGDTSLLEKAQEKLDKDIKDKERTTAKTTMDTARELVTEAASSGIGDGYFENNQYGTDLGSISGEDEQIFKNALGDYYKESEEGIRFSLTDSGELIDAYNGMLKARSELEKKYSPEELQDLEYYNKLNEEIKEMAENMPDVINAQQALFDIEKEEALADEQAFNSKIGLSSIGSVEEFEANKDKLIKKIQEETEWTTAQAEAYLMATEAYGGYAEAADFFNESGLGFNKDASEQTIKDIKEWFADLPEEDRTLAMTIDYTTVATKEEAAAALEEVRKKAEEAAILQEAEKLEVDEGTFDTYTEGLMSVNSELKENNNLTKQIALNNLKISKGLTTLTKSWDDNFEIIKRGNKASLEYAEAIGEVKKAFEEMFGVKPSTEYIEQYSNEINEMANGNLDSLQKLQDALAEDYVMNMDFSTAINEDWSGTIKDAQSQLKGLLEDIDTSIEVGEGTTLSSDFLDSVQAMLDAGVITSEQLDKLFRAKGFELEVEAWDTIDGPIKTITRTTYPEGKPNEAVTEVIEEKEKIKVPIINGRKPKGELSGVASKADIKVATYTKSTDKRVIDTSAAEEKADKIKDSKKKASEEIDRYHEIKEAIEDVENELDRLSKAKDRAFGKDKLAFMEAEQRSLKEQITLQEQLVAAMKSDLSKDQAELNKWGFSTDESGRITNYEEVYKQRIAEYNAMVQKGQKDEADEQWEEFEEAVEQYEETLNNLESEETELMNQRYDAEEKRLSDIQTMVEDNLEMTEDKLEDIEHQLSKIEDDAFAAAEAIALIGQEAKSSIGDLETYETGIRNILKMETANGSKMSDEEVDKLLAGDMSVLNGKELTEEQINGLREYRSGIYETIQDTEDYAETVKDKVLENFEAWNERLERQGSLLEHNHSILKSYRNIVDLVGADNLGIDDETLSKMTQQTVDNANASLERSRIARDTNKIAYEKAKEAFAKGAIDEEQMNAIEDAYLESEQNFMDSWNSALETAGEAFDSEVERILAKFDEAMGNLEDKLDWFDKLQAKNEIFLKDYEQTYEISKLNRSIQNSIDNTDNIKHSQALRNIQKDLLSYQEEGKEMSKYDLEYLKKKYDLEVARIALEEAQNAKSQVRLTRDSEGNFGYTYTADSEAVEKAEQNYEDKMYEMEKFLDESSTEIQEQIMTWNQMMMEELGALDKSADDYDEKAQAIVDHYTGLINSISQEGEEILIRGKEMNEEYGTHAAEVFNETIMGKLYSDIGSYQEFNNQMQIAISETLSDLEGNHQTYQQNVDGIFDTAGTDVGDFKNEVVEYLGEVDQANKDILETTGGMATDMASDFDDVVNEAVRFSELYKNALKPAMEAAEALAQRIGEVIAAYNSMPDAEDIPIPDNPNDDDRSSNGDNTKTIKDDDTGIPDKSDKKEEVANPDLNDGTWWYRGTKEKDDKKYIVAADTKDAKETKELEVTGGANDLWNKAKSARGTFSFDESELSKKKKKETDKSKNINFDTTLTSKQGTNIKGFEPLDSYNDKAWSGTTGKNKSYKYDSVRYPSYGTDKNGNFKLFVKGDKYWYDITGLDINAINDNSFEFTVPAGSRRYKAFDTGGYTGNWGPEGRLAMLHQKEIVLNAHDTENFLAAIGIVRDISDQIEKNAILMQYQNQLANYRASVGNSGETLQQEVHITAEFPNATDHNEIEEAFKNLTNLASQYANRKF